MESYIVRVYRRNSNQSGTEVAGLVEEVGTDKRQSFQTYNGLIKIIREVIGRSEEEHPVVCELPTDRLAGDR